MDKSIKIAIYISAVPAEPHCIIGAVENNITLNINANRLFNFLLAEQYKITKKEISKGK